MCRITVDGKESRFNMKMDILPELWNVKANKALGHAKDVDEINSLIDHIKASLYQIYRELQERGKQVTSEIIKNTFLGLNDTFETLLKLFDKHNEDARKLIGNGLVIDTVEKYELTRRRLHEFMISSIKFQI